MSPVIPITPANATKNCATVAAKCSLCSFNRLCLPQGLADEDVARLDQIISRRRRVSRDEPLYKTGDSFHSLYAVRFGHFKTVQVNQRGELLLIRNKHNDAVLWLRDWHTHLLAGKAGEQVLGVVGLIALLLLLSGLYLWWPRLSALAASLRWYRGPPTRRWFSWHRGAGVLWWPLSLLAVLTGVGMVYDGPTRTALRAVFGDGADARKPPKLGAREVAIDWPALLRAADGQLAGAELRRIGLPKADSGLVTIRMRAAGEWHPVGRSAVWLDPYKGVVLGVHDATAQDTGARVSEAFYPVHGGFVGGRIWQWLVAFTGLVPGFLLVTGFLFWRRRTARH